jgi:hypothetical protein
MKTPLPLLAAVVLAVSPAALFAADGPEIHTLHIHILPDRHQIVCTDTVRLPGKDGEREVRFRVRKEFKLLEARGAGEARLEKDVRSGVRWLVVPVRFVKGTGTVTLQFRETLSEKVKKSKAFSFVVGDETSGYVGPEGVYLPGGSGWLPRARDMILTQVEALTPAPWRVVSQGEKLGEKSLSLPAAPGGKSVPHILSRWKEEIPSDGLSLVAGKYKVVTLPHRGVALSAYLFPAHAAMAGDLLKKTAGYLDLYTGLLGPYPFKKFDIVENFFTSGYGMPTYTLLGGRVLDVIQRIGLRPGFIDHELVHNWWGNSVFVDYGTGNWCEGATTYCANYFGGREIQSAERAVAYRRLVCRKYAVNVTPGKDYPLRRFRSKTEDFENDIGYGKASMFFHLLRRRIGDADFWEALRGVARRFRGRKAGWEDFRVAFEGQSGQDLGRLFEQWIDRAGAPLIRFEGKILEKGALVEGELLALNYLDGSQGYDLDVPLRVRRADGSSKDFLQRVENGRARVRIVVEGPRAVAVDVDPEFHVFRRIPPGDLPPCMNATLAQQKAVVVSGRGDPGQAEALAWAGLRVQRHGKAVPGGEKDLLAGRSGRAGFLLLGLPEDWSAFRRAVFGEGGKGGFDFHLRDGVRSFTVAGATYRDRACALVVSFRLPSGAFATLCGGNSPQAVRPLKNLFHYGWDTYLVFKAGRVLARGALGEEVRTPDRSGGEVGRVLRALARDFGGRRPSDGRPPGPGRKRLVAFLAEELEKATGTSAEREPFRFEVPRPGQRGVVKLGGCFTGMELSVPVWFPRLDRVEIDGALHAAAGCTFEHIVHCTDLPKAVPGPALLLWNVRGRFARPDELMAALASTAAEVKAVVLYEGPGEEGKTGGGILGKMLEEGGPDPLRRIASALSRAGDYKGPLCLIAPSVEGFFELSGRVSGRAFVLREETEVFGTNLSARIDGTGAESAGEEILLTAHFDGLGPGYEGADDNASGVACVLEAARMLRGKKLKRSVRVVLFDAEEWGLYGSREYAARHKSRVAAVLNVDAVGNRNQKSVYVIGRSHHSALFDALGEPLKAHGFSLGGDIDRFAFRHGSDHYPFHEKGIPAVNLYASTRAIMNSREDTLDKVDFDKVTRLARALADAVSRLAAR